jgi:hypothetical protein
VRFTALKSRLAGALPRPARRFVILAEDMWDAKEHLIGWDARTLPRALEKNGLMPVRVSVPLPVQTRSSPVGARIGRATLYRAARLYGRGRTVPPFGQDLFVVARRP